MSSPKETMSETMTNDSDDTGSEVNIIADYKQIPMVCLGIRGDLKSIDSIEMKIRKEIPVLVMKGSGAVCDIIAFAYEELSEKWETT